MGSYEQVVHATTYFSDVEFIEWASKYELIPDIHQIRICNRCAKLMFIHFHANLPDGAVWRCSDYSYSNTLSIRIDSWTKDSKLPLKTLARLVTHTHTHTELHEMMAAPSFHFRSVL